MIASDTAVKERQAGTRRFKEIEPLNEREAQLVNAARRCLITALDHSRAASIRLKVMDGEEHPDIPLIELSPAALRVVAKFLEYLGERKPLIVVPRDHELTTQDAANMMNVSRPFIVKAIKEGRLPHHMVGSHRRISYGDFLKFRDEMMDSQQQALSELMSEDTDDDCKLQDD